MKNKENKYRSEYTMASLFIVLFFISAIKTFRLLTIVGLLVIIYSLISCRDKFFIRLTKPVLPFVILMLLPVGIRLILYKSLEDIDFTMMIILKLLISSILLGAIISKHTALYLVDGVLSMGLPQTFNRILALTFRYFHMINEDIDKGKKALLSRGIRERKILSSFRIYGEWIGGFFLKSSNHGDIVYSAMVSRGFQGQARKERVSKDLLISSSILIIFCITILIIDGKV